MTPMELAQLEAAELERWYRLPSPERVPGVTPPPSTVLLLWVCVALLSAVYAKGAQG